MITSSSASQSALLRLATLDPHAPVAIVRDGGDTLVLHDCDEIIHANGADALVALAAIQRRGGMWAGALNYQLGATIEPRSTRRLSRHATSCIPNDDRGFDDLVFARFAKQERFRPTDQKIAADRCRSSPPPAPLGLMQSNMSEVAHARNVTTIREYLAAGDCYQVNLTRRLTSPTRPNPRALYSAIALTHSAPHAMLLDLVGDAHHELAIVSASPEQFIRVDGRRITTAPIKGTARFAPRLTRSTKDRAEHVMIVDLARNDLGRVCAYGSVRVPNLATTECHPGLAHLVSSVHGVLRPEVGIRELIQATFPAASITGAPKPRVLEIINELETVRRDFYCGAVGWIDTDRGICDLSVAIRTFTISAHGTDFGVGGGIVWDSEARSEWAETELKAQRLLQITGGYETTPAAQSITAGAITTGVTA